MVSLQLLLIYLSGDLDTPPSDNPSWLPLQSHSALTPCSKTVLSSSHDFLKYKEPSVLLFRPSVMFGLESDLPSGTERVHQDDFCYRIFNRAVCPASPKGPFNLPFRMGCVAFFIPKQIQSLPNYCAHTGVFSSSSFRPVLTTQLIILLFLIRVKLLLNLEVTWENHFKMWLKNP